MSGGYKTIAVATAQFAELRVEGYGLADVGGNTVSGAHRLNFTHQK